MCATDYKLQTETTYDIFVCPTPELGNNVCEMLKREHGLSDLIDLRSDLQVCQYSTGGGNLAILLKQFKRLGVMSWAELANAKRILGMSSLVCVTTDTLIRRIP